MGSRNWDQLVDHLTRVTPLPAPAAARIVEEVVAYFNEPLETFVRRRHRELQASGVSNPDIFRCLGGELADRPVAAPALSERQIRRLIYG